MGREKRTRSVSHPGSSVSGFLRGEKGSGWGEADRVEGAGILVDGRRSADGRVVTGQLLQETRGGWELLRFYAKPEVEGAQMLVGKGFRKAVLEVRLGVMRDHDGDGLLSLRVLRIMDLEREPVAGQYAMLCLNLDSCGGSFSRGWKAPQARVRKCPLRDDCRESVRSLTPTPAQWHAVQQADSAKPGVLQRRLRFAPRPQTAHHILARWCHRRAEARGNQRAFVTG